MAWVNVAVAGAGLISGAMASRAGKKGANAQEDAGNAANAEQRRQYDQTRTDQMPFLNTAYGALDRQNAYLNGDTSGFVNSVDYTFARDQALQAQERGAAARGGYMGGGADADRIALASGMAAQNANNYWSKLAGQAGQGAQTAQNLGALGANMAGNIGNNLNNAAQARASSYANTANQWGNALQQGAGAFGQYYGNRNPRPSTRPPSTGFASGFGNNTGWLSDGSYGGQSPAVVTPFGSGWLRNDGYGGRD